MRASLGGRNELAEKVQTALSLPTKKEAERVIDAVIASLEITLLNHLGHGRIHAEARQLRQVLSSAQAGDLPEGWFQRTDHSDEAVAEGEVHQSGDAAAM